MASRFGMPYFLDDSSGSLVGADFTDIHGRMKLTLRLSHLPAGGVSYKIQDLMQRAGRLLYARSNVCIEYGPEPGAQGNVSIEGGAFVPIEKYLTKVGPTSWRFVASDSQKYTWHWRPQDQEEWQCVNQSNYSVANYAAKSDLANRTVGAMLVIEESYPNLACEILATLTVLRRLRAA